MTNDPSTGLPRGHLSLDYPRARGLPVARLWRTTPWPIDCPHHRSVFTPPPFHPDRPGLVAPVRVDPAGRWGPTRKQANGPRWRSSSHGLHVPASVDGKDPAQRTVEAAELLYVGEAVTGWAALRWQGGHWFTGTTGDGSVLRPVSLVTARHVSRNPASR